MKLKVMRLTRTPQPRTNSIEGFQSVPSPRKPKMFDLLTIPATSRPIPKIRPVKKVSNWSTKISHLFILLSYIVEAI